MRIYRLCCRHECILESRLAEFRYKSSWMEEKAWSCINLARETMICPHMKRRAAYALQEYGRCYSFNPMWRVVGLPSPLIMACSNGILSLRTLQNSWLMGDFGIVQYAALKHQAADALLPLKARVADLTDIEEEILWLFIMVSFPTKWTNKGFLFAKIRCIKRQRKCRTSCNFSVCGTNGKRTRCRSHESRVVFTKKIKNYRTLAGTHLQ